MRRALSTTCSSNVVPETIVLRRLGSNQNIDCPGLLTGGRGMLAQRTNPPTTYMYVGSVCLLGGGRAGWLTGCRLADWRRAGKEERERESRRDQGREENTCICVVPWLV